MGVHLTGSVGIVRPGSTWRSGSQPPANKSADQTAIIGLLAQIPAAQGGKKEEWSTHPLPGPTGMCPELLGNAIFEFQAFWKKAGTFKNIDGIVDPGGNTLRVLNGLVTGAAARAAGPNGLPPANAPDVAKSASALRSMFPHASNWTLDNAPGIGAGMAVGVSFGQLDMIADGSPGKHYITYAAFGAGLSADISQVTFSGSTRDMASMGGIGRVFSKFNRPLTLQDLCGPICILSLTGVMPNKFLSEVAEAAGKKAPKGISLSVFLLNCTATEGNALVRLSKGLVSSASLLGQLANVAKDATGMCMSFGECLGFDLSVGVSCGLGTSMISKIDRLDQVRQDEAKYVDPYLKQYEQGKKNMEDAIRDKLKDWNPF